VCADCPPNVNGFFAICRKKILPIVRHADTMAVVVPAASVAFSSLNAPFFEAMSSRGHAETRSKSEEGAFKEEDSP